jgi:hypothetical protein
VAAKSLSAAAYRRAIKVVVALVAIGWGGDRARAAEVTRVVSALDQDNRFDFNLTATFLGEWKSAFIKRESQSDLVPRTELIKDSKFTQTRYMMNLRADVGILWDVGFHVEAPYVLHDVRSLNFDQSDGSSCIYPGDTGGRPTCVNQNNSTILRDGILPAVTDPVTGQITNWGLNGAYAPPSSGLFSGPVRRGFENLGLGVTWAAFNERRDDTKPTWTLGFDTKLDIFRDMRFDPANPGANTAVGPGYHQFLWSTFVSKRFRYFDPYFGAWYMLPVRTNGSIYQHYQFPGQPDNQPAVGPQQRAGVVFGVEQIAWENLRGDQRVTVEVRGHMEQHFFGRSASELWEPLSGRSDCRTDTTKCRPGLDEDLGSGRPEPYPGVTETEAYGTFGGQAGVNIQVGKHVRFHGLFGLSLEMPHFITFANAGVDRDAVPGVQTNDPHEANPVYRELIDLPGRRFKVEGTQVWSLFLEGSLMF